MSKSMKHAMKILLLGLALAFVGGCASNPKVLVDHSFRGKDKTSKVLLELSGEETGGKKLYNASIRLCDLKDHKETACKDTLVLPNAVSESIY